MVLERPAAHDWAFARGVAGIAVLLEAGAAAGVGSSTLLAGTGLRVGELADHERLVTAEQELRVVRNLRRAAPRVSGVSVGRGYHVSTFGILGFALLSSPTLVDALNVALRYLDLSFTFAIPQPTLEDGRLVLAVDEHRLPTDVRAFLVERDLAAIHSVAGELLARRLPLLGLDLAAEGPSSPTTDEAAREVFGRVPSYAAARSALVLDPAHLDLPLPQANPQSRAMSEALCEDVVSRRRARTGVTQQTRVLITQHLARGAPMEGVARDLGLSVRTLRRRLAEQGTTYQELLDEVRASLSTELLTRARLGVEDTALRLGYAEASSFIHAFRRWHGTTPAAYVAARGPGGLQDRSG
ncbi:AraC family transcriptional regulator [Nocardioides marmoribigeumensis]|uniref:AraC-like DNA-binding protein n=1 Tax=Nocardioides marmoribigeumensis TaxID=433649 RepID=A0ABU2C132_9ACTN|nr:AraC family transcriptional regulator [Nocardioides marmoribigeumensis]MDR7364351.1 AraC-like DNA-binding protein [Nocardioides marmoribigeumensis]